MILLLRPLSAVVVKLRGRNGVLAIIKMAPNEKHDLAWWQRWLADHWA
jgi:hypothetical protein